MTVFFRTAEVVDRVKCASKTTTSGRYTGVAKFAQARCSRGFLLLPSLVLSPMTSNHALSPQDLIPCLNNGCAVAGKVLGNGATKIGLNCEAGSPSALQHCGCSGTLRRREQSRTEESECTKGGIAVKDVRGCCTRGNEMCCPLFISICWGQKKTWPCKLLTKLRAAS